MEKAIVILYNYSSNFDILGVINLPKDLTKSMYVININDKYKTINLIHNQVIYSSLSSIKVVLCKEKMNDIHANNNPFGLNHNVRYGSISSYSHVSSVSSMPSHLEDNDIIEMFFSQLTLGKINLKSYFRQDKIDKILESESIG